MALAGDTTYARTLVRASVVKRVFIYGINYAPEPTGVGRYTGEIGSYLTRQGLEVEVVTAVPHYPGWVVVDGHRNRFSIERMAGARVTRCPLFLKSEMRGMWRVLRDNICAGCDLAHPDNTARHGAVRRADVVLCTGSSSSRKNHRRENCSPCAGP